MSNAGNVRVKPTELVINDKTYLLKYDFNAFIELEEIYGSIDEAMLKLQGEVELGPDGKPITIKIKNKDGKEEKVEKRKFSLKAIRDFLWSGMLYGDENITKRSVSHMLEFTNFGDIVKKMMEAVMAAMPQRVDDEKN
jgi:hypothetical protein